MLFKKKRILRNPFRSSNEFRQMNISQLMQQREELKVILPENPAESFVLLSHLVSVFADFRKSIILLPKFQITFFEKLFPQENVVFRVLSSRIPAYENQIILNFNRNKIAKKIISRSEHSLIGDIDNFANIHFLPPPQNPLSLLQEFAAFFRLELISQTPEMKLLNDEFPLEKAKFLRNKFPHFVLHLTKMKADKKLEILVKKLKFYFSANVYFTANSLKNHDFPNLQNLAVANLFELYQIAKSSDIFLTDNKDLSRLFSHFEVRQIFLGSDAAKSNFRTVRFNGEDNILELVNMIQEISGK